MLRPRVPFAPPQARFPWILFPTWGECSSGGRCWDPSLTACPGSACRNKRPRAPRGLARISAFFTAPVVVFLLYTLSYFAFLCLFAYVLMVDFQPTPSYCEYLVYLWLLSLVCEEIRQVRPVLVVPGYGMLAGLLGHSCSGVEVKASTQGSHSLCHPLGCPLSWERYCAGSLRVLQPRTGRTGMNWGPGCASQAENSRKDLIPVSFPRWPR